MKRNVLLLVCGFIATLYIIPAYAAHEVINFDESFVAPANTTGYNAEPPAGTYLSTEYNVLGVRFVPSLPNGAQDGTVYLGGTWGITGSNGPQFLGCDGYINPRSNQKYAEAVIQFDKDVVTLSIDFTVGENTDVPLEGRILKYYVFAYDSAGVLQYTLSDVVNFPEAINEWKTIAVGDPDPSSTVFFREVRLRVYLGRGSESEPYVDAYLGFDNLRFSSPPLADFSGYPREGCSPLTVSFSNLSIGASSWSWDFGDGTTSTEQNPYHTYNDPGTYTVSLTAENQDYSDTKVEESYITVYSCGAPVAEFSGQPRNGCSPLRVCFANLSQNATSWEWQFGDGTTSTEQNPCHTYRSPGTYTVVLTAWNDAQYHETGPAASLSDTETKSGYIVATACDPPIAQFYGVPTSGLKPLTVVFTNQSIGGTSFSWDFGDGSTSTAFNPTHVYQSVGVYTVSLTATNAYGSDTRTRISYIVVEDQCVPPVADFSISYPSPGTAAFTDLSSRAFSWSWDFGDGTISTEQNPVHQYAEEGEYTVSLTVYNRCGSDTEIRSPGAVIVIPYDHLFYFPYVVSGDGWETELGLINSSDQSIGGTLRGYNEMGIEQDDHTPIILGPHGRAVVTVGSSSFVNSENIRFAVFYSKAADLKGYARIFKDGVYRTSLPAVSHISLGDIFIPHIASKGDAGWETKIVLLNTHPDDRKVSIDFDDQLSISRRADINIPAQGQYQTTIEGYFGGFKQPTITSGVVKNGIGLIGVVLYERGNEMDAILLSDKTEEIMYYPHIICSYVWSTGIVAYNPSDTPCTITILPHDYRGNPLTATTLNLQGRGKYTGTWCNLGLSRRAKWCTVETDGTVMSGLEAFYRRDAGQMVAYQGLDAAERAGVFPLIENNGWTGIVLVNTEGSAAGVTLSAYDDAGTLVATQVVAIDPFSKFTGLITSVFTEDISNATHIEYSSDMKVIGIQGNFSSDFTMADGLPGL